MNRDSETLAGNIERVTYHNADNGYAVLKIATKGRRDLATVVGRPEIQKFVGALQGQRAKKGIFVTTSEYSNEAKQFVSSIDSKVVLIDGRRLSQLMIDFDIGVSTVTTYAAKRLDTDYFSEE